MLNSRAALLSLTALLFFNNDIKKFSGLAISTPWRGKGTINYEAFQGAPSVLQ